MCALFQTGFLLSLSIFVSAAPNAAASNATLPSACTPIPDALFSWKTFADRIQTDKSVRRVEDALCLLPERFRSQYALAYESRSVQGASPEAPRAILFGPTAGESLLSMTFNGDPEARGFDKIEAIRTIDDGSGSIEQVDVTFRDDRAPVVMRNPQSCLGCHGTRIAAEDRRWLFDASPLWEGFYGSQLLVGMELESAKDERRDFEAFKASASKHPRYRQLAGLTDKLNDPRANPALTEREARGRSMAGANFKLVQAMARSNDLRVARMIKASENYALYKWAIYAALTCPEPSRAVPDELLPWHQNQSSLVDEIRHARLGTDSSELALSLYDRAKRDSLFETASLPYIQAQIAEAARGPGIAQAAKFNIDGEIKQEGYNGGPGNPAQLRLLFEGRANPISMAEWNVDVDLAKYRFNNNSSVDNDLGELRPLLRSGDSDLLDAPDESMIANDPVRHAEVCERLIERSRQALRPLAFLLPAPPAIEDDSPTIEAGHKIAENACMHCHGGGRVAPRINFHDPSALALHGTEACRRLKADGESPERMPRFLNLEESELASLNAYFRSLDAGYACE